MSIQITKVSDSQLPETLYHGSGYEHRELKPGFIRSGILEQWDKGESNKYLYFTTDKTQAVELGFISAIEKRFNISRAIVDDTNINLYFNESRLPSKQELLATGVWLYTVEPKSKHWLKNQNDFNGLKTEYKTKETVSQEIVKIEKVQPLQWFQTKQINIFSAKQMTLEQMNNPKDLFDDWLAIQADEVKANSKPVTPADISQPFMLHIDKNPIPVFWPMMPKSAHEDENNTTSRVTVSPSLLGCLVGYDSPGSLIGRSHEDLLKGTSDESLKEDDPFRGGYLIHGLNFEHALKINNTLAPSAQASDEHWLITYSPETKEYPSCLVGKLFIEYFILQPVSGQAPKVTITAKVQVNNDGGFALLPGTHLGKGYHRIVLHWADSSAMRFDNCIDPLVEEIGEEEWRSSKELHATNLSLNEPLADTQPSAFISAKALPATGGPSVLYTAGLYAQGADLPLAGNKVAGAMLGWCSKEDALKAGLALATARYEQSFINQKLKEQSSGGGFNVTTVEIKLEPQKYTITDEFVYLHKLEVNISDGWHKADKLVSAVHGSYRTHVKIPVARIIETTRLSVGELLAGKAVSTVLTCEASAYW